MTVQKLNIQVNCTLEVGPLIATRTMGRDCGSPPPSADCLQVDLCKVGEGIIKFSLEKGNERTLRKGNKKTKHHYGRKD